MIFKQSQEFVFFSSLFHELFFMKIIECEDLGQKIELGEIVEHELRVDICPYMPLEKLSFEVC